MGDGGREDTIAASAGVKHEEAAAVSSNSEWDKLHRQASENVEEWRRQHPKATFLEITTAVDEQLSRVRAQMLEDVAMKSEAAQAGIETECPKCGQKVRTEGRHKRKLLTEHDESVEFTRSYARCPNCGERFFPPGRAVAVIARCASSRPCRALGAAIEPDAVRVCSPRTVLVRPRTHH